VVALLMLPTASTVGAPAKSFIKSDKPALSVHGLVNTTLSPPYRGFHFSHKTLRYRVNGCSAGAGGGWGTAGNPTAWISTTGELQSEVNVSSSSACWNAGNRSAVWIETYSQISRHLHLSSSSGRGRVSITWNLSVGARADYSITNPCIYSYATQSSGGPYCYDDTQYRLSLGVEILDSTTRTNYCPGNNVTGSCNSVVSLGGEKIRISYPHCYITTCHVASKSGIGYFATRTSNISGPFAGNHDYTLVLSVYEFVYLSLGGWPGYGTAEVNMATHGHGAYLSSVVIS
jgi:hypothetical protein